MGRGDGGWSHWADEGRISRGGMVSTSWLAVTIAISIVLARTNSVQSQWSQTYMDVRGTPACSAVPLGREHVVSKDLSEAKAVAVRGFDRRLFGAGHFKVVELCSRGTQTLKQ